MALSDYFRPDLFRPRNLVPAFVAIVVVAGAWFAIRLTQTDEPPPPQAQAAAAPTEAPPPAPLPEAEPQILPTALVASRDIGRGVLLSRELVDWQEQPEPVDLSRAVIEGVAPVASVMGAVTRRGIVAGELITWDKLVMSGMPGFVTAVLSPGHRAMTVSVDEATTRAQIIYPGDRVDVILVHVPGSGGIPGELIGVGSGPASQVIVRDVRVLAVGSATMDMNRYGTTSVGEAGLLQRPEPPSGETYTLEVTTLDAERIALATVAGRLTLVVRPVSAVTVADSTSPMPDHYGVPAPVRFPEVMEGLESDEEELLPPDLTIRIIRGRGRSSEEALEARQDARAEEAANLLAEALRGG